MYQLFPGLKERITHKARLLSGGEQQMLAIGRALMAKSSLMMMDEPSLGLAPLVVADVFNTIRYIHSGGKTVLLVEQNARAALELSDYAYVLETGRVVLHGDSKEVAKNEAVKKAYLG